MQYSDYSELTKRQYEVYEFLVRETKARGYVPTVRDIMHGLGKSSTSTIQNHLSALIDKGFIKRTPNQPRAVTFTRESVYEDTSAVGEVLHLPVLGSVAAGAPILAEENIEDTLPFPAAFAKGESFMLKVKGDSMIDVGILDGDYVVVSAQPTANNGDVVVAIIDEEATVKTFYREPDRIRLQPENESYKPIYTTDVRIAGKVIALLRTRI